MVIVAARRGVGGCGGGQVSHRGVLRATGSKSNGGQRCNALLIYIYIHTNKASIYFFKKKNSSSNCKHFGSSFIPKLWYFYIQIEITASQTMTT